LLPRKNKNAGNADMPIDNGNTVRRTISLSRMADKILLDRVKKTGLKISTIIEQLLVKMGGEK